MHILALTAVIDGDHGGILRVLRHVSGLPLHLATLGIQTSDGTFGTTRSHDDEITIDERRFGIAPALQFTAEIFNETLFPHFFTSGCISANHITITTSGINHAIGDSGSGARSVTPAILENGSDRRFPKFFTRSGVDADKFFLRVVQAHGVKFAADNGKT